MAYDESETGSAVTSKPFTTTGTAPPLLSAVAVSSITASGASLAATSNTAGHIYYKVVVEDPSASIPCAGAIKMSGDTTKTASTANNAVTINFTSLSAGTNYKVRGWRGGEKGGVVAEM